MINWALFLYRCCEFS